MVLYFSEHGVWEGGNMKVLICLEGEGSDTRSSLSNILERSLHQAHPGSMIVNHEPDGNYAVQDLMQHDPPFDVVVLGVRLRYINGWDVCEHVAADPRLCKTAALIVGSCSEEVLATSAPAHGADAWIAMPCTATQIREKIAEAIRVRAERLLNTTGLEEA